MKYLSLFILLISLNGLANDIEFYSDNNTIESTDIEPASGVARNPEEGHDPEDAPISDYQYLLLSAALALGIIYKYKK